MVLDGIYVAARLTNGEDESVGRAGVSNEVIRSAIAKRKHNDGEMVLLETSVTGIPE